jgi:hypothetical protein
VTAEAGAKHKCAATVTEPGAWHRHPCQRAGKVYENGAWWCGIHAPSADAKRREKRSERWKIEERAMRRRNAIRDAHAEVLKAAREWRASDFSHERHEDAALAGGRGHTDSERKLAAAVDALVALESEGA